MSKTARNEMSSSLPNLKKSSFTARLAEQKYSLTNSTFGKDALKITISGHHEDIFPPHVGPAPGQYNPPIKGEVDKKYYHVFEKNVEVPPISITANIDFFDVRVFQWKRPITTEPKPSPRSPPLKDGLGFDFIPSTTLTPRPIKIKPYYPVPMKDPNVPSPDTYSPRHVYLRTQPSYSVPTNKIPRDQWLRTAPPTPGPGTYTPDPLQLKVSEPKFTIGKKSRSTRRKLRNPKIPTSPITIDVFIVSVPRDQYEYALNEIQHNRDLVALFHIIMKKILNEKPETPLGVMRDYFIELKKQMYGTYE